MSILCKGNCLKYKVKKDGGKKRYTNGQSYCKHCMIFIKWDGLFCPCCGSRLKKSAQKSKYKSFVRIC